MKRYFFTLAIAFTLVLCLFIGSFTSYAGIAPSWFGDIDMDDSVTVKDVTLLQKHLASLVSFNKIQLFAADVDGDGRITVKDVTMIQKDCAGMLSLPAYQSIVERVRIISDYDSGKAMVGTPVTFKTLSLQAPAYLEPLKYEYYVNQEKVSELSECDTLTYTFDKAGGYSITVMVYNALGGKNHAYLYLRVVDAYTYDSPKITAVYTDPEFVYYNAKGVTVFANAVSDASPCEYKFELKEYGIILADYSEKNSYSFTFNFYERGEYTVVVTARDKLGRTDSVEYTIDFEW